MQHREDWMRSTKLVTRTFEESPGFLYPLGDMHWGHPNCQRDVIEGYLESAEENNALILLMGDLIENSTRQSVGAGVYEQIQNPDDQIAEILDLLGPYKDRIVAMLTGNHEERSFKDSGIDPSRYMSRVLGVPYLRYGGFLRLILGNVGYTAYVTHGSSGSATSSGKLNAVKKLAAIADADVYLMGHMHELLLDTVIRKYLDLRSKTVKDRRQHFVVTGGFLSYEDSYSEMKNYSPSKIGAPRIRFSDQEHDIHVSI
jgi:predicted phosphodiesterase